MITSLCLRGLGYAIALGYVTMASFLCTKYDVSFSHLRSAVGVSFDIKKACRRLYSAYLHIVISVFVYTCRE